MNIEELEGGAVQYRAAEVQDVDTSNREMLVRAAPYDMPTDIGADIIETFLGGTFSRAVRAPQRVSAWWEHGGPLIGRGLQVEDRADGVWIRAKIGRTTAANDVLSLIEDELLKEVSVEFRPIPSGLNVERRGSKLHVTHSRAHLLGFAVVSSGAYGSGAYVASIREEALDREREAARLWLASVKARRGV